MVRKAGSEDKAKFVNNQYEISIDDTLIFKASATDVVATKPIMSASISTLIQSGTIADRDIGLTEHFTLVDTTTAALSVFLPAAGPAIGRSYTVKKISIDANAVTISASAAANVEGVANVSITGASGSFTFMSDGNEYHIVGSYSGSQTQSM